MLAEQGARVFVGDYSPLDENICPFKAAGITSLPCDVRSEAEVRRLVEAAVAATGTLDILVNNAGIGMAKQITEVTEEDWDACFDTNLKGAFFASKHAIAPMRAAGGGVIVNISSNAGLLPRAHDPVYSISKAALIALTKSLALCHARDRIRINAICPGPVGETRMMDADLKAAAAPHAVRQKFIDASPLARAYGRMIAPREIAEAVLYLASDAAAMVTGTALALDGGKSLGVPPQ
jgi:NAD(P)-dependent dehydrogenase (short-subunit alcohol dehydrogenase family)